MSQPPEPTAPFAIVGELSDAAVEALAKFLIRAAEDFEPPVSRLGTDCVRVDTAPEVRRRAVHPGRGVTIGSVRGEVPQ